MIGQIPSAAITLLLVKAFCYLFPVPFLIKIYRKYKHISYLGFAIADILLFFSSTLGYGLVYLPNTNINAIWILSNMHLYASLWVIILSLLIAQFEKVPPLSHLITLVFGILFGLIVNTGNFTLSLENSIYQASYSNSISILGL